jgi:transcription antitermination factor NusG
MMNQGLWYALQVRAFFENVSERILAGKGYETFLPTYIGQVGRSKNRELPLFPGYMFCRLLSDASGLIVTTPGVVRVVGAGGNPIPVTDQEIEDIRMVMHSGLPQQPWRALAQGKRVRIESGPMRTLEGVLVSCRDSRKLVVTVALLQRSVAVELDATTILSYCSNQETDRRDLAARLQRDRHSANIVSHTRSLTNS